MGPRIGGRTQWPPEEESWEDFSEEVTFELGLKVEQCLHKGKQGLGGAVQAGEIAQTKAKRRKVRAQCMDDTREKKLLAVWNARIGGLGLQRQGLSPHQRLQTGRGTCW